MARNIMHFDTDDVTASTARSERHNTQILPGQPLDDGTVIASVIINDTDHDRTLVQALLLTPESGRHYRLIEVWEEDREVIMRLGFQNIVPAVEAYVEGGGDY